MKRKQMRNLCIRQILLLLICFVMAVSDAFPVTAAETVNRTVKAGVFFFDGYHMQDSNGVYTGYGIDLLNLISQYSHLNF